ncbi:MAG: 3-deoxy-manno-octulosonate cytidylyltransferase [Deltaproteobacteria bacterium]|nr:3-deoxy-manno-octulosonate cytidylyltransferase [Deltaproteobacteria bacterium]
MKSIVAVIPARFDARRLPGKPLIDLAGTPMVVRVAERAASATCIHRVVVATDDTRIRDVVEAAGIEVCMTSSDCMSGSDRVAAALGMFAEMPDLVVNVQGDEPLIDPRDIDALVVEALRHPEGLTTLVRPISSTDSDPSGPWLNPNTVKVVASNEGRALYFSRAPIPYGATSPQMHVGLYAYPPKVLSAFVALPMSALERTERLEQLRALEAGIPIYVTACVSRQASISVDTPEDVASVRRWLAAQAHRKEQHDS